MSAPALLGILPPTYASGIAIMHCSIYKGRKAPDTYLFVPVKDDLSAVPAPVMGALGEAIHVMDLVLSPDRRLARSDAREVLRSLLHRGCYVQLPPKEDEPEWMRPFKIS